MKQKNDTKDLLLLLLLLLCVNLVLRVMTFRLFGLWSAESALGSVCVTVSLFVCEKGMRKSLEIRTEETSASIHGILHVCILI